MYLLDSNIVSGAMAVDKAIVAQLTRAEAGGLAISCVTLAEILYGLLKLEARADSSSSHVHRKQELFRQLMDHIDVLPWDSEAALAYAAERVACEAEGQTLDRADLMILAHASSTGRTLVTRDLALRRRDRKAPHRTRVIGW